MNRTGLVLVGCLCAWVTTAGWAADRKEEGIGMPRPAVSATVSMPPSQIIAQWEEPLPEKCPRGHPVRSCLGRFREWLCYRSHSKPCPECCCQKIPCCYPPLYAFFLDHCACARPPEADGIPISYNYLDLLQHCGDCGNAPCRRCR